MTDRELAELLRRNPDLSVDDPYSKVVRATMEVARVHVGKLSEHDFQTAVIAECDRRSVQQHEYGFLFAIPNGQYRQGQRMEPGLRRGVPDLCLPVPSGQFHGLFIELKCGDNKPVREQLEWLRRLRLLGYRCEVVWDNLSDVMHIIEDYLNGAQP